MTKVFLGPMPQSGIGRVQQSQAAVSSSFDTASAARCAPTVYAILPMQINAQACSTWFRGNNSAGGAGKRFR